MNIFLKRRSFIQKCLELGFLSLSPLSFSQAMTKSAPSRVLTFLGKNLKSKKWWLLTFDLHSENLEKHLIPAANDRKLTDANQGPHSILIHPAHPHRALVIPRGQGQFHSFDLKKKVFTSITHTDSEHQYYGHGAYSQDGSLLFLTRQQNSYKDLGDIEVRKGKDLKQVTTFSSFGLSPHEIFSLENNQLIIGNGGSSSIPKSSKEFSSFSWVSTKGKLINQKVVPTPYQLQISHFLPGQNSIFVGFDQRKETLTTHKNLSLVKQFTNEKFIDFKSSPNITPKQKGETLSLAVNPSQTELIVTNHHGATSFWDIPKKQLINTYEDHLISGVVYKKSGKFLLTSLDGNIFSNGGIVSTISEKDISFRNHSSLIK